MLRWSHSDSEVNASCSYNNAEVQIRPQPLCTRAAISCSALQGSDKQRLTHVGAQKVPALRRGAAWKGLG